MGAAEVDAWFGVKQHPRLEGGSDVARHARIDSAADLAARRQELAAVVRAWCDDRDREP